eukprot:TRINITY_DN29704_c0_g1_i1.p2 TRINITY_DN29704_c0_g1~~TRINITY_DN29704_c0_g1_i1.p2  ORF type:complete len:250 (+),score=87.53 TRINITY_DN29704_c0_g1_i1:124-873(+)
MGNASSAAADTQEYRDGYPGKVDQPELTANVDFYAGRIATDPGKDPIDRFHTHKDQGGRMGDYEWLEQDHSYIQWLFPIRERGLNPRAQVLQKHEADTIAGTPALQDRFRRSYETMLDFYGMRLVDAATGAVARKDGEDFLAGYANLNSSMHNYLRITRILKALGEVGLEHYKLPFMLHVLDEIFAEGHLTNTEDSCLKYWGQTLKGDADRAAMERRATELHAARRPDMRVHDYRDVPTYTYWGGQYSY